MTTHRIWEGTVCFTTHVVRNHTPVFIHPAYSDVICSSLAHCRKATGLRVYGYVIMPDHLHLLTDVPEVTPAKLQHVLSSFRRYTATRIAEMLRLDRKQWAIDQLATGAMGISLWETHYRPIDSSREDIFDQKLHYIHMNPVRTGFVCEPQHWRYSSAGVYYERAPGPLEIDRIE